MKRTFSTAGIIAQRQPPAMPASTMSGRSHAPSTFQKASATALPASPPITYCPSAPMFQTPARKPKERPRAMSTSGVALMSISLRE